MYLLEIVYWLNINRQLNQRVRSTSKTETPISECNYLSTSRKLGSWNPKSDPPDAQNPKSRISDADILETNKKKGKRLALVKIGEISPVDGASFMAS